MDSCVYIYIHTHTYTSILFSHVMSPQRKRRISRRQDPNWSDFNAKLLKIVLRKLSFPDILHSRVVCSSWFSASQYYISCPLVNPPSQSPWLMLLGHYNHDQHQEKVEDEEEQNVPSFATSLASWRRRFTSWTTRF